MTSSASQPARPAWAVDQPPAVFTPSPDGPKPAERGIYVSSGCGSLMGNILYNMFNPVAPSGPSGGGPAVTVENISARYDDEGDELWMCRHTILTYTDGTKTLQTRWYSFTEYLQTNLDKWEWMEAQDVWALQNNENRCYDGDVTDWDDRRLNKDKIIELWKEQFP